MLIFLSILVAIILIIIILLLLPVHIIIKKDIEGDFEFNIKTLFFELNDKSNDKNSPFDIKKLFGLDKKDEEQKQKKRTTFTEKITYYSALISDIFSATTSVFKKITVLKLHLNIICAEEDAADTAISYGACCAVVLPIASTISSLTVIKKDAEKINISCDYTSEKGSISFDIHFFVRIYALLSAVIRFGLSRAKRKPITQQKNNKNKK